MENSETKPKLQFDILTLFPGIFAGFLSESILGRAQKQGLVKVNLHNFREFADLPHRACDDTPYGGGGGMVLKPEPVFACVEELRDQTLDPNLDQDQSAPVVLLTPQGRLLNQEVVTELSSWQRLIMICGRYEGVDERIRQKLVTDEISIGDYVLGGGEVAAMVVVEALSRQVPGVLGFPLSHLQDSHSTEMGGLLEGPHFTRPAEFRGMGVPDVLVSGNHAKVDLWRREQSLLRTAQRRPDLLRNANLTQADRRFLHLRGFDSFLDS